ncbi:MAG: metallophosphoesterase [Deltaproteobacteria bacterium]|nr:metallophosphoesterase [Deltaproteobacteria bacterium]
MSAQLADREEVVLLSDVHLNEVIATPHDGWWEYKSRHTADVQDQELADMLGSIDQRRPAWFVRSVIVFNGDTFDFDNCFSGPDGQRIPTEGLPPTVASSVWKMRRLLSDHHAVVIALARFLARGNRAIFVMGNHDRELHFPEVQEVLRSVVASAAPVGAGERVARAIAFEPWFVYRPGVLYAEHGNQYDATCSYRDVLDPSVPPTDEDAPAGPSEVTRDEIELETPFGSLLGRHTLSRLGTFNPYNDESFILSLGGYFTHWRRYYFPRRPFFRAYFAATFRGLRELVGRRRRQVKSGRVRPDPQSARWRRYAAKKGVAPGFLERQLRLTSVPIVDRMRLLLHEVWLDRFAFLLLAVALLVVGIMLVEHWYQAALLGLLLPVFAFVMRAMGRGSLALQERARWGLVAESIAEALRVPVVAFGHSHRPERRPLTQGGRYYNLGSWAPVLASDRESTLARARRYLIVRADASGRVHVAFERWGGEPDSP